MQYTLTIKNGDARTILELNFDAWSVARNTSDNLERGYSVNGEYVIIIYDNWTKKVAYSALTKTTW